MTIFCKKLQPLGTIRYIQSQFSRIFAKYMLISVLRSTITDDLDKVNKLIMTSLFSEVPLIQDIGKYIVQGGGKRLRPLLVLICAKAYGEVTAQHITMATVIEFIHTATLLHDDVVDSAVLRRGGSTANHKWGNQTAVLVGDFLYSRAFQLMVQLNNLDILRIIADATNTIAEGEVLQLLHQHDHTTSEQKYLHVVRCKTAKLFEAAASSSSILCAASQHEQLAFSQYGLHLGTAYQLLDDLLDYQATNSEFGKQLGNDLAEGKPTMPLIYLLHHGTEQQRALIASALSNPNSVDLESVQAAITESGALAYTLAFAQREANLAKQMLSELPSNMQLDAAYALADFVVQRTH